MGVKCSNPVTLLPEAAASGHDRHDTGRPGAVASGRCLAIPRYLRPLLVPSAVSDSRASAVRTIR